MADYITEISEADFKKLDVRAPIIGHKDLSEKLVWEHIEKILEAIIRDGFEPDQSNLDTIAVAVSGVDKDGDNKFFFDKDYEVTGAPSTVRIGVGVTKIYSKRNYFTSDKYFYVRKSECRAVYLIHLDPSWKARFKVKHKVIEEVIDGIKTFTMMSVKDDGHFHEDGKWTVDADGRRSDFIEMRKESKDA